MWTVLFFLPCLAVAGHIAIGCSYYYGFTYKIATVPQCFNTPLISAPFLAPDSRENKRVKKGPIQRVHR